MATQWETPAGTQNLAGQREPAQTAADRSGSGSNGQNRLNGIATTQTLARSLGWFSIGLGAAEVLAPGLVAKIIGTRNNTGWIRAFGVREIVSGVGLLTNQKQSAPWLWSRVGGDVLDLASLGAALANPENERGMTAFSVAAVAGVAVLDVMAAQMATAQQAGRQTGEPLHASVVVTSSPEECYAQWRKFEELPRFMSYLDSVQQLDDRRSHWCAIAPGGKRFEWDAEITSEVPGRMISWRSLARSQMCNSGSVEFQDAPGGRGTVVDVHMTIGASGQPLALAKILGKHPEQMIYKDLRRFKQIMEVGEVITTEGQPAGRPGSTTWLDSIAR